VEYFTQSLDRLHQLQEAIKQKQQDPTGSAALDATVAAAACPVVLDQQDDGGGYTAAAPPAAAAPTRSSSSGTRPGPPPPRKKPSGPTVQCSFSNRRVVLEDGEGSHVCSSLQALELFTSSA